MKLRLTMNQYYPVNGLDLTAQIIPTKSTGLIWINHAGSNWLRYQISRTLLVPGVPNKVWTLDADSIHTNRHQKGVTELLKLWLAEHSSTLCDGKC